MFSKPHMNVNFQDKIEGFEEAYINYFDPSASDNKNHNLLFNWMTGIIDLENKRMLDVGCGSGKFVFYLANKGLDITGLEPSKPLFEKYLKDKKHFYNYTLEEFIKLRSGKYDVITLFDVLEHVDYPAQLIREISTLQQVNSYLLVEIPLYGSFPSVIMGKRWHFYNKYHLSYFGRKRLTKFFKDNGYQLVKSRLRGKYFNIDYLFNYMNYFMGVKRNFNSLSFLYGKSVYINPLDIYIACFKKVSN